MRRCAGPCRSRAETICVASAPAIVALMTSSPVVHATGDRDGRLDPPGQSRGAAEAQRQLRGIRQRQRPNHFELVDVDDRRDESA